MIDIAAIMGAISGVISLIAIAYLLGHWKGTVDSELQELSRCITKYPPAEIALMTKTLWDIYVIDALSARPDLAEQSSPFYLKQEAKNLIPSQLKGALDSIPVEQQNHEAVVSGWQVVKFLGIGPISQMAEEKKLSLQEAIAILSTYLEERHRTR